MSSVETDLTGAGQKRLWSENQSDAAVYEEASSSRTEKYHEHNSDRERTEKQVGTQVTTIEECPLGKKNEETGGKYSSSAPSTDVAASDNGESLNDDERKYQETEIANDHIKGEEEEDRVQQSTTKSQDQIDFRRAYWRQNNNNNYEKMMAAMGIGDRPVEEPDQRQYSRSSTPSSSSRNISPSDIHHRTYHNAYGTPFSSSTSTPMFVGAQRPSFIPVAPQPPVAPAAASVRHHGPFPFFANPFMVPFSPHLPQANVSQSSPPNENYPTEDWSHVAGIRRNPDSGGFYLHPQYYHELLQQYLRNMTVNETGSEDSSVAYASTNDLPRDYRPKPSSAGEVHNENPENVPENHFENDSVSTKQNVTNRHESDKTSSIKQESNDAEVLEYKEDLNLAQQYNSSNNSGSSGAHDEAPTTKVTRPGSLQLEDDETKDEGVQSENIQDSHSKGNMENPAMDLIKKQISEIEKQILRKTQNQNIRKMDAKEIEAFLLMEQQRNLEANLFESSTNCDLNAWAPSALQWLQNDPVNWERAGAVADAFARQQFETTPDQRSLYELAAAAAAAAGNGSPNTASAQFGQPNGFVQAHFPQTASAFVPPAAALYPTGMQWPPGSFYPPNAAPGFGYARFQNYFPPVGNHVPFGGSVPYPYAGNHQSFTQPAAAVPPFARPTNQHVLSQQQYLEQERAGTLSEGLQMSQRASIDNNVTKNDQARMATDITQETSSTPDSWKEAGVDGDHIEEDEPVWVLRESYVRKLKREEERQAQKEQAASRKLHQEVTEKSPDPDCNETDTLLSSRHTDSRVHRRDSASPDDDQLQQAQKKTKKKKEVMIHEPAVLIEGVLFRARYLGSTQLVCDGRPTKATRMMQAQEAVSRIKAPDGEPQPSTDVDLFISTEKIMILNTDLQRISETDVRQDIMMDHPLRTISYIADIGELVVLMARRVSQSSPESPEPAISRTPKIVCHVFESEEAQFIAQSIGQAFQVAYMEFLRANGIDDPGYLRDVDYQEVLNQQEIFGEELAMFARKETQKDVVVPKQKGEPFGVVIVESGWGSMLPTVVIANLMPGGPAARSSNLNIGDHIIALNGISFVGLPLSACQNHIKNVRHLTAVKLTIVHTPPVVEVRIKRPDTKYQLGFSVQNGVICSLLRGGIAERGGVRVGHRIIEINSQSVVAVPHEKIVTMLATAVGEIQMKTMPTSMFRLLTGQEAPNYI